MRKETVLVGWYVNSMMKIIFKKGFYCILTVEKEDGSVESFSFDLSVDNELELIELNTILLHHKEEIERQLKKFKIRVLLND